MRKLLGIILIVIPLLAVFVVVIRAAGVGRGLLFIGIGIAFTALLTYGSYLLSDD